MLGPVFTLENLIIKCNGGLFFSLLPEFGEELIDFLLFSHSVMYDSLRPHGLQHARLPSPSPSPRVCPSSCPLMPSNHLILCRSLLILPSIFLPSIRVSSNESVLRIRWPKCWRFSFSISPSSEYSGLISFRIDWFDLLVVHSFIYTHTHTLFYNLLLYGLSQNIE